MNMKLDEEDSCKRAEFEGPEASEYWKDIQLWIPHNVCDRCHVMA
jgi:hypothetical protein